LAAGIARPMIGSPGTEGAICNRPHFVCRSASHPKHAILPRRGHNHAPPLVGRTAAQRCLAISRSGTNLVITFPDGAFPTGRRDILRVFRQAGPRIPLDRVSYCRIGPTTQQLWGEKAAAVACNALNWRRNFYYLSIVTGRDDPCHRRARAV